MRRVDKTRFRVLGRVIERMSGSMKDRLAWIQIIDEDTAQGLLKAQYEDVRVRRGRVSNVMKAHSLDPETIHLHLDLYLHLMFGKSTLTRVQREMIAVVVSRTNNCRYCVTHHGEALLAHVRDEAFVRSLGTDFLKSGVTPKDRAMLVYAAKLTRTPGDVSERDVAELRRVGFSDEEILRVNLITSYFNFANRIVSGLGIPLEAADERLYKY